MKQPPLAEAAKASSTVFEKRNRLRTKTVLSINAPPNITSARLADSQSHYEEDW